jgi:hypothetical protein
MYYILMKNKCIVLDQSIVISVSLSDFTKRCITGWRGYCQIYLPFSSKAAPTTDSGSRESEKDQRHSVSFEN